VSSISDETAKITLEVELVAGVSGLEQSQEGEQEGFFGEVPDNIQAAIDQAVKDSVEESVNDALENEGVDPESLKELTNMVKDVQSKGINNITSMAKNPESFMENTFISALSKAGPHGVLAATIITSILAAPEAVKAIIKAFAVKGAPLNQDYRYSQEEYTSQEFDRRVQFKRLTGDDPVITINTQGFVTPQDPDFPGNSLIDANLARTARIGLRDNAYGYIHGI
jgi:hypothetical protein